MEVYTAVSSCLTPRQQDPQLLGFRSYPPPILTARGHPMGPVGRRENRLFWNILALCLWASGSPFGCCRADVLGSPATFAVRSHELQDFTIRETQISKQKPQGCTAQWLQSRECARPGALATSWLFPASNVVGVLGSGRPGSTQSRWPLAPRLYRNPSKGHSDLDLSILVSGEEGRR